MLQNLQLVAAEETTLRSMNRELVWNPAEIVTNPIDDGGQAYGFVDAVELLQDMEQYSHFSEPFDALEILSGQPNHGMAIDS